MTEVLVLGAGMVGVSTALALRERGFAVTLVDRRAPGLETSYGNAGLIQAEAVEPYPLPRDPGTLIRFALQLDNAVHYHWRALPGVARPLWLYFRNSSPARHRAISAQYSRLIRQATADHAPWIAASGAEAMIRRTGFRTIFHSPKAFAAARQQAERLRSEFGVSSTFMDGAALTADEPALHAAMAGAVHWTDPWSCSDPGGLVSAYAAYFQKRGGQLLQGDAAAVQETDRGWRLPRPEGDITAAHLVVALGPWSPAFLQRFSYRIAMVFKRGYHRHYRAEGTFTMPLHDIENSYLLCPMRKGLRITTGAELAPHGAAPTPIQLQRAERAARQIVDLGAPVEDQPWTGQRPCMPGMLPVIGPLPRHRNLWANFGHGHQGFTLGPTSAAWLAELMTGKSASDNPFAPARLSGL